VAQETALRSDDVVALLASVPERINDLVSALDELRLEYRHAPAFPTLHEVVAHLCQAGAEVDGLLRRAYLDHQRELPVRTSLDPTLESALATPLADQLQRFARVRRRTVDLLRGLSESDWQQEVFDPLQGVLTLLQVCSQVAQHEVGHLSQLRNLIALLPEP
jgi:DinB family protein